MDKTILKSFAIYSRSKLIQEIKNKASLIGITEEGVQPPLSDSTSDLLMFDIKAQDPYLLTGQEIKQYNKLIKELEIRKKDLGYSLGYETLIEEISYTWFNRLIAIRFMEVNNYIPHRMRVLSSGINGVNQPEIVTSFQDANFDYKDDDLIQLEEWYLDGSAESMDSMFQYLFIKQSNALNDNLPELFEKTDDYAELLLTISYNDPEGVLYKLVHEIPEEYFNVHTENGNGQVEIIGWLYQYYNTELKANIDSKVDIGEKVDKTEVSAKTQLFTPDWIVKYMVENTLGKMWIEKLLAEKDSRTETEIAEDFGWKYYISEAKQEYNVREEFIKLREDRKELELEKITFLDPAMGSFHVGVYAFDVFMQLYESQGYSPRIAAQMIIEKNLYGIDIDKRAYQLSYFALMMKGRQHDRRILDNKVHTNLYTMTESNNINRNHINFLGNNITNQDKRNKIKESIFELLDIFEDSQEYGSLLHFKDEFLFEEMENFVSNSPEDIQISFETIDIEITQEKIKKIINLARILSKNYDLVSTNPPYMKSDDMSDKLSKYIYSYKEKAKYDMYSAFIYRCYDFLKPKGIMSLITMHNFMFSPSFLELRDEIKYWDWINMVHLGSRAFSEISGEVVQTAAYSISKTTLNRKMYVIDVTDEKRSNYKEIKFLKRKSEGFTFNLETINSIPSHVFGYSLSDKVIELYKKNNVLDNYGITKAGVVTGKDNYFVRLWYEVNNNQITYNPENTSIHKYVLFSRGGTFNKWYGNSQYVLKLADMWDDTKTNKSVRRGDVDYYYKRGIGWSQMAGGFNKVFSEIVNSVCKTNTPMFYPNNNEQYNYILGFLNSEMPPLILRALNPTLSILTSDILNLPFLYDKSTTNEINQLVDQCISISKDIYSQDEVNWQFEKNNLIGTDSIKKMYEIWSEEIKSKKKLLKFNENKLNRIYSVIMGLEANSDEQVEQELNPISKVSEIKSFISYAVGCIFGRYSLDKEGVIYAGGEWTDTKYKTFKPVQDNVLLITDEEYFEDDIVNRFVDFVEIVYGKDTLEENLEFIADSMSGNGSPRKKLRNYFLNNFFKDHCQMYSSRSTGKVPIYWLYDSSAGKTKRNSHDGFKALVYMHRYDEDTTGRVRMDYLHKLQRAYEFKIDNLKYEMEHNDNTRVRAKFEKELERLTKQLKECKDFDEKIGHLALSRIPIDLDDGVKINYQKVQTDGSGKKLIILSKI